MADITEFSRSVDLKRKIEAALQRCMERNNEVMEAEKTCKAGNKPVPPEMTRVKLAVRYAHRPIGGASMRTVTTREFQPDLATAEAIQREIHSWIMDDPGEDGFTGQFRISLDSTPGWNSFPGHAKTFDKEEGSADGGGELAYLRKENSFLRNQNALLIDIVAKQGEGGNKLLVGAAELGKAQAEIIRALNPEAKSEWVQVVKAVAPALMPAVMRRMSSEQAEAVDPTKPVIDVQSSSNAQQQTSAPAQLEAPKEQFTASAIAAWADANPEQARAALAEILRSKGHQDPDAVLALAGF